MKKKELKKAFEKNFEKIYVSKELKEKTINLIKSQPTQKTSLLPYLKNFAAIFIVTLLCISIYRTTLPLTSHDSQDKSSSEENNSPEISDLQFKKSIQPSETKETLLESASDLYGSIQIDSFISPASNKTSTNSANFDTIKKSSPQNTISESSRGNSTVSITETDFLTQHPNAEKIENGYIIYENNKETLYIFKNNKLENIIIIN